MLETLPYAQEDNQLEFNEDLASEFFERAALDPSMLFDWLRHGFNRLEDYPGTLDDSYQEAQNLLDELRQLQADSKLVAGLQGGMPRDRSNYVHLWVPSDGEKPQEFFQRAVPPINIDHRVYLCADPKDTQTMVHKIIDGALSSDHPLYFKYIQQGTDEDGAYRVNDQIDQIVMFLAADNWQFGLALADRVKTDLLDRPTPLVSKQIEPGIAYVPNTLYDSIMADGTPFHTIASQLSMAMSRSVLLVSTKTDSTRSAEALRELHLADSWPQAAKDAVAGIQRLENPTVADIILQLEELDLRTFIKTLSTCSLRLLESLPEELRELSAKIAPQMFDEFSRTFGYESVSLRANRESLINNSFGYDTREEVLAGREVLKVPAII